MDSPSPIDMPPPSEVVPTESASGSDPAATRVPVGSLTYDGTLSIVATIGQPAWSGTSIAYPVHLEISTHGLGRGHAYTWGGNVGQPDDAMTGSSPGGGTSVVDYVAHYPCERGVFSGDPDPSALVADSAAWFVELQGYGAHDVHILDLVTDCAAVGHPMAEVTPAPTRFSMPTVGPAPTQVLTVPPPFMTIGYQPDDGLLPFTPATRIALAVTSGGGSTIGQIDITVTPANGGIETYSCASWVCQMTIGPYPSPGVLIAATATDALGRTAMASVVITIDTGIPPTASPGP